MSFLFLLTLGFGKYLTQELDKKLKVRYFSVITDETTNVSVTSKW